MLDALVQDVLHFGPSRIGQNAAIAQRPRAPFLASLEPTNHAAAGDVLRRGFQQSRFVQFFHADFSSRDSAAFESPLGIFAGKARAPGRMIHHKFSRSAKQLMLDKKCGANGKARVSRRRLDIHFFELSAVENFAVSDAVERHAAGEAQIFLLGLPLQRIEHR